jgi:hypothetical protein
MDLPGAKRIATQLSVLAHQIAVTADIDHMTVMQVVGGRERDSTLEPLDLGIMSNRKTVLVNSTAYRVAPVAFSTAEHNKAALGHAKLT